jgi:hypothetical protein
MGWAEGRARRSPCRCPARPAARPPRSCSGLRTTRRQARSFCAQQGWRQGKEGGGERRAVSETRTRSGTWKSQEWESKSKNPCLEMLKDDVEDVMMK